MIGTWISARWGEISTKFGLLLGAVSTIGPQLASQYAAINPHLANDFTVAGIVAGGLLVVWNEKVQR